jgi:hypothetical protein
MNQLPHEARLYVIGDIHGPVGPARSPDRVPDDFVIDVNAAKERFRHCYFHWLSLQRH